MKIYLCHLQSEQELSSSIKYPEMGLDPKNGKERIDRGLKNVKICFLGTNQ